MSENQLIDQLKSIDISNKNTDSDRDNLIKDITNNLINNLIKNEIKYENYKKFFKILNDFKNLTNEIIFNENDIRLINCKIKITKENINNLQDSIKNLCFINESEFINDLKEFEKSFDLIIKIQQNLIENSIEFKDWYKIIPNKLGGGILSNPGNYETIKYINNEFKDRFPEINDWELKIIRIFNRFDIKSELIKLSIHRVYSYPISYNQNDKKILIEWSKSVIIQGKIFKNLIPIELVIKHILNNYKIKIDRIILEEIIENNDFDKLYFYFEDKC
ncbi:hypothetical protein B5S31_g5639 [[Candida] boidinii]|nr:hypothetical protein B5S29_g5593 [[Candida] boidinii]OWB75696.1 hypothetical protein B5S31_g5639 [[Candida] boidinii]OWB80843.1 hypothetical protein B5S32_g5153 [[Candida] boidinii]